MLEKGLNNLLVLIKSNIEVIEDVTAMFSYSCNITKEIVSRKNNEIAILKF